MLLLLTSKWKHVLVAGAICVISIVAGVVNYQLRESRIRRDLVQNAELAAVAFDRDELRQLSGSRADLDTAEYKSTKQRLRRLRAADPRIRYVYLFRGQAPGQPVVFLADSADPGAEDESLPGDAYREAEGSPGLQSILRTGTPSFEGPLRDEFGDWVTGYALAGARRDASAPVEILGVDMAAEDWSQELWLAAVRGALYTWILLGFPVFAFLTTRHHGEQREAIRNLSEAVEQSHSAITILDLDHRIEYANRGLCQQIGYGRRELIGRHWRDFIVGPGASATIADLVSTIRMGRTWEGEWVNQRKDGTAYPVHGMVTPVKHRDGSMACFVAILDDVTEIKRKESELRDARDLAQAGDRAKGHFLATMSHEVRTPLNGIVGFTSLLLDTPLSDEQREFVQTIRASGEALIQLTGDILDFARIESGKLKLDPIACDPRDCMEEALDLHAARAAEKKIELLHGTDDNVPSAVLVDGGRLRQVLVNLIGNAVKFTETGEVEVRARLKEIIPAAAKPAQASNGAEPEHDTCVLEFTVRDTGIGISPEQQKRLFKPFSQVDDSSTRRYGGVGLGLAICKNLVQLMGGSIGVTNSTAEGSTFAFTIRVPVAAAHPPSRHLAGLRLGIAAKPGALRSQLTTLLRSWAAEVMEADEASGLAGREWHVALVDLDDTLAAELSKRPEPIAGLPPEKTLALVPISLPSELRGALRTHFRLLINRPVHHGPLFAMLSGSRPNAALNGDPATQFGFNVLVVEDNEVNQRLLQRVLASLGCPSSVVSNGREAMDELTANSERYDLVLLDLHMPEMDGLSALQRIRAGDAGPRAQTMWVIALTADARPEQRTRGFATGLNDYLTKPLRTAELEAALRRFRTERLARKS